MGVFIELTTDLFSTVFSNLTHDQAVSRHAGKQSARRPLRGLEIKDDSYAYLRVVDVAGNPINVFDSSNGNGESTEFSNFILQSVQEARMEKHQLVETFGENYIFFFGEQPRFLDVQCLVLNSNDFNWEAEFWANYDNFWRGSKLTELGARLYLFYDDNVVEGYMLNAQAQKVSTEPLSVMMTFRLFLTNYYNVSFITDKFPIRASASLPANVSLEDGTAYTTLLHDAEQASVMRGVNDEAASLTIQQQALAKFGGAWRLAAALRAGYLATAAVQNAGRGLGTGPGIGIGVGAGIAAGATTSIGGFNSSGVPVYGTANYLQGFSGVFAVNLGFGSAPRFPSDSIFGPGYAGIYSSLHPPAIPAVMPAGQVAQDKVLRSRITDNVDEWTGAPTLSDNANFEEPEIFTDVEDLPYASILLLGAYGVRADGFASLGVLGMAPRFAPAGIGIGAGAGFTASASFGFGVSAGITAGVPGGIGYGASVGVGVGIGPTGPYAGSFLTNANGFTTNPAIPTNPYANYPGYGAGYGSALPGTLPGFSAGPGLGFGYGAGIAPGASYGGGVGVGAVTQVGGLPTCFALESYPGDLNVHGTAYQSDDGVINAGAFYATRGL